MYKVNKTANTELEDGEEEDWDEGSKEGGGPDGDDVVTQGVCGSRKDDVVGGWLKDGEVAGGGRGSEVDLSVSVGGGDDGRRERRTPRPMAPRMAIVRRSSQTERKSSPIEGR